MYLEEGDEKKQEKGNYSQQPQNIAEVVPPQTFNNQFFSGTFTEFNTRINLKKTGIISNMSRKARIINGFVFIAWIALISLLLYRNYEGASLEKTQALTGAIDKATYWYDIYAGHKKNWVCQHNA